jgi:zinc/manganese transport system substrate-binding protein
MRSVTRRHVVSFAALAALLRTSAAWPQSQIRAVATFSILGDLVSNVGGERVQLKTLVGPNGDVHVYAPTPRDVKTVATANIVFVNGLGLEGWLNRLIAASGTHASVVAASRGVKARNGTSLRERATSDPHAWQSVANTEIYVGNIRDGLIAADPAGEKIYQTNAAAYLAKLDSLDAEIKAAIDQIPVARRKIVTTHDAFGYFGQAYGVEFIAPEGLSTDAEPSARDFAKLIEQIRREKIPAVFFENAADPRLVRQIAQETGAKMGGALYSDALSRQGGPAATYIDLMRNNVRELTRALIS